MRRPPLLRLEDKALTISFCIAPFFNMSISLRLHFDLGVFSDYPQGRAGRIKKYTIKAAIFERVSQCVGLYHSGRGIDRQKFMAVPVHGQRSSSPADLPDLPGFGPLSGRMHQGPAEKVRGPRASTAIWEVSSWMWTRPVERRSSVKRGPIRSTLSASSTHYLLSRPSMPILESLRNASALVMSPVFTLRLNGILVEAVEQRGRPRRRISRATS